MAERPVGKNKLRGPGRLGRVVYRIDDLSADDERGCGCGRWHIADMDHAFRPYNDKVVEQGASTVERLRSNSGARRFQVGRLNGRHEFLKGARKCALVQ